MKGGGKGRPRRKRLVKILLSR